MFYVALIVLVLFAKGVTELLLLLGVYAVISGKHRDSSIVNLDDFTGDPVEKKTVV